MWLFSTWLPSAIYSFSPSSTHLHCVRNTHISCLAVLLSSFSLLLHSFHPKIWKPSTVFYWPLSVQHNLAARVQKTATAALTLRSDHWSSLSLLKDVWQASSLLPTSIPVDCVIWCVEFSSAFRCQKTQSKVQDCSCKVATCRVLCERTQPSWSQKWRYQGCFPSNLESLLTAHSASVSSLAWTSIL